MTTMDHHQIVFHGLVHYTTVQKIFFKDINNFIQQGCNKSVNKHIALL